MAGTATLDLDNCVAVQAQRREALEEVAQLKDQLAEAHDAAAAAGKHCAAAEAALEESQQRAEDSVAVAEERAEKLAAASARASALEEELVRHHARLATNVAADANTDAFISADVHHGRHVSLKSADAVEYHARLISHAWPLQ